MTDPGIASTFPTHQPSPLPAWLDRLWVVLLPILLVCSVYRFQPSRSCAYLGTDFRGYYAAAQIARQRGFAEIYNQRTQEQFQAALSLRCPDGNFAAPLIAVSMPYLPVYIVVILPFTFLDFTGAYYLWVLLNLIVLLAYLRHFTIALGARKSLVHILQWALCVPVLSNLALGQSNIFLMICLGEFVLSSVSGRRSLAGFWLGAMLVKPHILILLLPGLVLRKNWSTLLGFAGSGLAVLLASALLAGWSGVWSSLNLAAQFSGALIQTGPTMMNFRALALNLEPLLPAALAWAVAICGMALVAGLTLFLWRQRFPADDVGFLVLIATTLAATFAVTWHSHFYLLMLLLPLLITLASKGIIPAIWLWFWMAGPPIFYGLLYLANPNLARNHFGLGVLALNLFLLSWGAWRLRANPGYLRPLITADRNHSNAVQSPEGPADALID